MVVASVAPCCVLAVYFVQTAAFMIAPIPRSLSWISALNLAPQDSAGPNCGACSALALFAAASSSALLSPRLVPALTSFACLDRSSNAPVLDAQ